MLVLAASLRLALEGAGEVYGYELFARLAGWDDRAIMNHGTLYRCLRSLENQGLYCTTTRPSTDRPASATPSPRPGLRQPGEPSFQLAAADQPAVWVNIRYALPPAGTTGRQNTGRPR